MKYPWRWRPDVVTLFGACPDSRLLFVLSSPNFVWIVRLVLFMDLKDLYAESDLWILDAGES